MIALKQLTISMKTLHDNKINVSCSANQQNVTLHVKHDHQYRRNFNSLNIIWCSLFFCIYWDLDLFSLSRNTSSVLHSMLNAKRFEIVYALQHLYIMYSNVKTPPPVTLRNYQPVAWVLYQQVIDQSKADIFIKPGIIFYTKVCNIMSDADY